MDLLSSHRRTCRQTLTLPHNPFESLYWQGEGETPPAQLGAVLAPYVLVGQQLRA